jgi:hypothetical protein
LNQAIRGPSQRADFLLVLIGAWVGCRRGLHRRAQAPRASRSPHGCWLCGSTNARHAPWGHCCHRRAATVRAAAAASRRTQVRRSAAGCPQELQRGGADHGLAGTCDRPRRGCDGGNGRAIEITRLRKRGSSGSIRSAPSSCQCSAHAQTTLGEPRDAPAGRHERYLQSASRDARDLEEASASARAEMRLCGASASDPPGDRRLPLRLAKEQRGAVRQAGVPQIVSVAGSA